MKDERFLGLDKTEQATSILIGGFYVGFSLADTLVNRVEKSECQPVPATPASPFAEMQCSPTIKTAELTGGSALIIASTFAAAAAIAAIKKRFATQR